MKTATELLTALEGHRIFTTTRGTTGDASGLLLVDEFVIDLYEYADVCSLNEIWEINEIAYEDCIDYIDGDPVLSRWDKDEFLVIRCDTDYILAWEQE